MKALEVRDLKKVYKGGFEALKGISFDVEEGDFMALLGPNGAGKSTTIGVLCSLVNKNSGDVSIFGHDIDKDFPRAKMALGVVPQEFNFNQFEKVYDILITQAGYYGLSGALAHERAEWYLKELGLWEKRDQASRSLSGGMKRRLMIARALIHEPKLLILDEPTAGVDIELRRSMWDFLTKINKAGTTIILTTHYLEEAESLCRTIAIIDHGEIVENTTMKKLLTKLDTETFVLDIEPVSDEVLALDNGGELTLEGARFDLIDSHTLEVEISKGTHLNGVFAACERASINVKSLRNKTNRLEELFVSLVKSNQSITQKKASGQEGVA